MFSRRGPVGIGWDLTDAELVGAGFKSSER